jgi:hypothetical protein
MLSGLNQSFVRGRCLRMVLCSGALVLGPLGIARGATLQSGGSTLLVNPDSAVMNYSWLVDGMDQFGGSPQGQESFFFSVGDAGPQPLSALTHNVIYNSGGVLTVGYTDPGEFTLTLSDNLAGGTNNAALTEVLSINNTSAATLNLHIFQYDNFNAGGESTLALSGTSINVANQSDNMGDNVNVNVDTPDEYQIANDSSVYMKVTAPTFEPLSDNSTGPITGDTSFGFEWDPAIGVGGSDQISITESVSAQCHVVPLPGAGYGALATLGGIAGIAAIRRARRSII